MSYASETSTCRSELAKYCVGNGLDIGAGGDAIVPHAICLDRAESDGARAHTGSSPTHLVGDMAILHWFRDGVLDFVFSSHALEDSIDTRAVLAEWVRVVRPGGRIILFLPDEQTYRAHCQKTGQPYNHAHQHADFGPDYMRAVVKKIPHLEVEECRFPFPGNAYSFSMVLRKTG